MAERKPCGTFGCDGYIHIAVNFDGSSLWCPEAVREAQEANAKRRFDSSFDDDIPDHDRISFDPDG